ALPLDLQLESRAIYRLQLTALPSISGSEVRVTETATGRWLKQIPFVEEAGRSVAADVFRTLSESRITLQPYRPDNQSVPLPQVILSGGTIRKVAEIAAPNQSDHATAIRRAQAASNVTNGR